MKQEGTTQQLSLVRCAALTMMAAMEKKKTSPEDINKATNEMGGETYSQMCTNCTLMYLGRHHLMEQSDDGSWMVTDEGSNTLLERISQNPNLIKPTKRH